MLYIDGLKQYWFIINKISPTGIRANANYCNFYLTSYGAERRNILQSATAKVTIY